ncbi:V-type ATPase subunit family protein [Necator americanus]|uniref:V-type proton ATPase subunit a n=1 Tax=Necator americanus TaxID=51031 RepID=W2SIB7_NECAM|nr:V-type ATPase subunit family protein [Necator americanus]ETN68626.1 V-type ATPase subunit family protein [Necator americanus]
MFSQISNFAGVGVKLAKLLFVEVYKVSFLLQQDTFTKSITSGGHISGQNDVPLTPLLNDEKGENAWFVAGVIPLDKKNTFERVLWRACRRTAFVRISDITLTLEDPVTLAPIMKCVFIVFFKGESLKLIIDKKASGCDVSPILNEMARQTAPPTFHRTNKFTSVFQSIVDSYGVASYREINPGSYCAPSLLIGLINMFMLKERPVGYMLENNSTAHHPTCYLNQWYPEQAFVEKCLIFTALGCIPVMLLGRPLAAYLDQKKMAGRRKFLNGILADDSEHLIAIDRYLHEHSLADAFVNQAIHTIEFVLGCVSHTASYLRLWALSLAHAQLSEVLWHMVLIPGISSEGNILTTSAATYVVFFFFAIMSLSILVMMEGLSAFLHALRLHWVEFQSKFYQGAGHPFRPYSLQECLETAQHLSEVTEDHTQCSEVTDEL